MKNTLIMKRAALSLLLLMAGERPLSAQQTGTGCLTARWGVDAGLYSGVMEFGAGVEPTTSPFSRDWFQGTKGSGLINETDTPALRTLLQTASNPSYERRMKYGLVSFQEGQTMIDGIYARDPFGGTGGLDPTSYNTASKNGEDPAIWDPGIQNVLGKNDIIDIGGHMYRDGQGLASNLWFVGLFNMAEPGGTIYMDFEFYVEPVSLIPRPNVPGGILFTSGGPQLGHTAYTFDGPGNITKVGDFIFSVSVQGSGASGNFVDTRLWVSRADWERLGGLTQGSTPRFKWTGTYDGAFTGSPYGYAGIKPLGAEQVCGYLNNFGEIPSAPPWGTKNTKTNSWGTSYEEQSINEVSINLTALGMDHASLSGVDPCYFPLNTFIIKTRASDSFTAQLKDFAGPYSWGQVSATLDVNGAISCANPFPTIAASPQRSDVKYIYSTADGNFINLLPVAGNESAKGFVVAANDPGLLDPINTPLTYLGVVPGDPWDVQVDKAGTYNVTVLLPTGCPVQQKSVEVIYDNSFPFFNGPPVVSYTIPCDGTNGTITATASGATKPYTFTLYKDASILQTFTGTSIQSTHTFTGLVPGNYRVEVKGQYACTASSSTIVIPARIPVTASGTVTKVNCFGQTTGAVNLSVSGGKQPLTYFWSTGSTSQNLTNVGAGNYTVIITDADGCETIRSFTVTTNTAINGTITQVNDPGNSGAGSASISVTGGTAPYTYQWSKTGAPTYAFQPSNASSSVTGLSFGQYTVVVTDSLGCTASYTIFIFQKEICNDGIDNDGDGLADCDDSNCGPTPPLGITAGNSAPCVGTTTTYTAQIPGGVSYNSFAWSVPTSATIIGSATGGTITVQWNTTAGGQICVRGKIFDCLSSPACINVSVNQVPATPGNININN